MGVVSGANDPAWKNLLLRNHGGCQVPHGVVAPAKKKKFRNREEKTVLIIIEREHLSSKLLIN
jgi:hypothetical protein